MTSSSNKPTTKFWVIILGAIFVFAIASAFLLSSGGLGGKVARIYVDGTLYREIDLAAVTSEYSFTVETSSGYNTVSLRPGGICVSDADCSDHTCVNQGWLTGGSAPIVCLPHSLVIQLEEVVPTDAPDVIVG